MSEPRILVFDEINVVKRGNGVLTRPLVGHWIGAQGFTTGTTTFPPGAAIKHHTHNVEEAVTVLEGDAQVDIDGKSYRLKAFDTTYAPADVPHRFVNVGTGPMSILWCYASANVTRTLVETGETVPHLSPLDIAGASQ